MSFDKKSNQASEKKFRGRNGQSERLPKKGQAVEDWKRIKHSWNTKSRANHAHIRVKKRTK